MSGLLIAAGAGVVVIGALYWQWKLEGQRREALAALAIQGGWEFSPAKDTGIGRLCDFEIFSRGEDRYAFNTMTGSVTVEERPYALDAGDFSYTIEHRSSKGHRRRTRKKFSYLVLKLPYRHTPALQIRKENLLDKVAQAAGFEDIDFESEEFSRTFCVTSSDKRFAYDLIHPRTMAYLLDIKPPGLIQVAAGRLCVTDGMRRWKPDEFRKRLSWARNFVALWPEHVAGDLDPRLNRPA